MLTRQLARVVSRRLVSSTVASRVVPFASSGASMSSSSPPPTTTTLCVLTHEKLLKSRPIAER